jgi:hypothetical protein
MMSPIMQTQPLQPLQQQHGGMGGSLVELSAFVEKQQALLIDRDTAARQEAEAVRQEAKLERAELEAALKAEMEKQRQEMEKQRQELVAALKAETALAPEIISEEQLKALQDRFDALHAAKLLTDAELFALEDVIADFLELRASVGTITFDMAFVSHADYAGTPSQTFSVAAAMHKMVSLSAGLASDAAFARQLKRKFV